MALHEKNRWQRRRVHVDPTHDLTLAINRWAFNWSIRQKLYRHLAAKISSGVLLEKALEAFRKRLIRRKQKTPIQIISNVLRAIKDGARFHNAIGPWIPPLEASLISSGIEAGKLPQALELIIKIEQSRQRIAKAVRGASIRPLVLGSFLLLTFWSIGYWIAPMLQATFPEDKATGLGASLYIIARWAQSPWLLAIPIIVLLSWIGLSWAKPRWTGRWRILAEKYCPPLRLYRDLEGYAWLKSFVGLMQAGKTDIETLEYQMKTASPWLHERLLHIRRRMMDGQSLYQAMVSPHGKNRPAFNFPNPDILDEIESFAGLTHFRAYIEVVADEWAQELEGSLVVNTKKYGFLFELAMYIVVIYLVLAVNSLSGQMSTMPTLY